MNKSFSTRFTWFNKRDIATIASIAAPLVFVLSISLYMHAFVVNAIEANLSINMGIICGAAFGVFLIFSRLFAAQVDFRIIERFGREAKQGVYMKTLLEQDWLQNRYVRHYLSHIANTGGTLSSQIEQSAIESELHALQTDYDSRLELPQFLVGFMIAMGLLGTFIGLLETLTGISGMLDGMGGGGDVQKQFMKLVVELRKPLSGMGIAFSASMFGLVASLMLSIMMTNLRRYISRVISLARNVMHDLTEISHGNFSGDGISPNEINTLLSQAASSSAEAGNGVPAVTASPSLPAPQDANNDDVDFISRPYERHDQGRFGGGIDPAMSGRFDILTRKIESLLVSLEANATDARKLNELIGFGPRMKETGEKTLDEIRSIATIDADQHTLMQSLVSSNLEIIRTFSMFVDSQKLANSENTEQLRKLANLVLDMRDVDIGNGRHLNGIKENFTQLCKNTEMIEMMAGGLSGQTALLEVLVQETRRSQSALATINQSILANAQKG